MEQYVQFQRIAIERTKVYQPDRFEYRPEKGWAWLQWLAIKVLRWRKCHAFIFEETAKSITVNLVDLEQQIIAQHKEILDRYGYRGVEVILCGPHDFAALQGLPITHPIQMAIRCMWDHGDRFQHGGRYTEESMRVYVIPHMKGVLMLPKDWNK